MTLNLQARNAVAKYLGVTRGHAEILICRLPAEVQQQLVDAVDLTQPEKTAAALRRLLDAAAKGQAVEQRQALEAAKQADVTGETPPDDAQSAPAGENGTGAAAAAEPPARGRRGKGAK